MPYQSDQPIGSEPIAPRSRLQALLRWASWRESEPHRPLMVVERKVDSPYIHTTEAHHGARLLHADMTSMTLLDSLGLETAELLLERLDMNGYFEDPRSEPA